MKTMPRARTCIPRGTCVAVTSSPAANAGNRIETSAALRLTVLPSSRTLEQSLDRIVEQAEQILCGVVTTDGERQHDDVDLRAFCDPLRRAIALVSGANDHFHRLALDRLKHLGQVRDRRLDAGLRF